MTLIIMLLIPHSSHVSHDSSHVFLIQIISCYIQLLINRTRGFFFTHIWHHVNNNFHKQSGFRESRNYSELQPHHFIWGLISPFSFLISASVKYLVPHFHSILLEIYGLGIFLGPLLFVMTKGEFLVRMDLKGKCTSHFSHFSVPCSHCPPSASHQDLCQALESLSSSMAALSASAQKVADRGPSVQEAAALQQRYEGTLHQAKERQATLETLRASWQR